MLIRSGVEIIIRCELVCAGELYDGLPGHAGRSNWPGYNRPIYYCVMCPLCSWSGQVKVPEVLCDISYPSLLLLFVVMAVNT